MNNRAQSEPASHHHAGPVAPGPGTRAVLAWMRAAAGWPRLTLTIVLCLMLGAMAAATRLGVDTDSSRMLSHDLAFQARAQAVVDAFPSIKNTVLVVVRSEHRDAADATATSIARALAERQPGIGRVFTPVADEFLISHGLLYDRLEALDERLSRLSQASNLLAELRGDQTTGGFLSALDRAVALAEGAEIEPDALAPFLSEAARVLEAEAGGDPRPLDWQMALADAPQPGASVTRIVSIEPALDFTRLNPAKPAIEAAHAEIARLDPGLRDLVEVGVTGDPVLRAEELQSVISRLGASLALSVLLVSVVLFLALGRVGRVGLALGTVLVTLVLTTGFAAVAVGALNLISVAFVVLMVGLGIDFAIHLMAHLDEAASEGADAMEAVERSGSEIGAALGLSAATTSVAFLAFTVTDFVGMGQLGLIGGVGVLIALAVALSVIPAAVVLRPSLLRGRGRARLPGIPGGGRWPLVAAATLFGLGAFLLAPQARFDADPMNLRSAAAPSVVTYGWLTDDPAVAPLRLSLLAPDDQTAAAAAAGLAALPEVDAAIWLDDLVPEDQLEKLDLIDLAWPSLQFAVEGDAVELTQSDPTTLPSRLAALDRPEARALATALDAWFTRATPERTAALDSALFAFFPLFMERLRLQLQVGEVTAEDLPPALVDRFRAADGLYRVDVSPSADVRDPAARAAFVDAVASVAPEAGGPPAQIEGASRAVSAAMIEATLLALAGTLFLAGVTLRRLGLVAAIVLPLVLAAGVTMAASVLLDLPFNYANIIVLPLMIGVGVDAGVHLALRSAHAEAAVFETSTPRAVLASALTTIAAFGTLGLSEHPGTASMGIMLTIAMIASVAMIFAVTPPLAARVRPR